MDRLAPRIKFRNFRIDCSSKSSHFCFHYIDLAVKRKDSQRDVLAAFNAPYRDGSSQHQKLTRMVAEFILKGGMPLYVLEKESFKAMLESFDSR